MGPSPQPKIEVEGTRKGQTPRRGTAGPNRESATPIKPELLSQPIGPTPSPVRPAATPSRATRASGGSTNENIPTQTSAAPTGQLDPRQRRGSAQSGHSGHSEEDRDGGKFLRTRKQVNYTEIPPEPFGKEDDLESASTGSKGESSTQAAGKKRPAKARAPRPAKSTSGASTKPRSKSKTTADESAPDHTQKPVGERTFKIKNHRAGASIDATTSGEGAAGGRSTDAHDAASGIEPERNLEAAGRLADQARPAPSGQSSLRGSASRAAHPATSPATSTSTAPSEIARKTDGKRRAVESPEPPSAAGVAKRRRGNGQRPTAISAPADISSSSAPAYSPDHPVSVPNPTSALLEQDIDSRVGSARLGPTESLEAREYLISQGIHILSNDSSSTRPDGPSPQTSQAAESSSSAVQHGFSRTSSTLLGTQNQPSHPTSSGIGLPPGTQQTSSSLEAGPSRSGLLRPTRGSRQASPVFSKAALISALADVSALVASIPDSPPPAEAAEARIKVLEAELAASRAATQQEQSTLAQAQARHRRELEVSGERAIQADAARKRAEEEVEAAKQKTADGEAELAKAKKAMKMLADGLSNKSEEARRAEAEAETLKASLARMRTNGEHAEGPINQDQEVLQGEIEDLRSRVDRHQAESLAYASLKEEHAVLKRQLAEKDRATSALMEAKDTGDQTKSSTESDLLSDQFILAFFHLPEETRGKLLSTLNSGVRIDAPSINQVLAQVPVVILERETAQLRLLRRAIVSQAAGPSVPTQQSQQAGPSRLAATQPNLPIHTAAIPTKAGPIPSPAHLQAIRSHLQARATSQAGQQQAQAGPSRIVPANPQPPTSANQAAASGVQAAPPASRTAAQPSISPQLRVIYSGAAAAIGFIADMRAPPGQLRFGTGTRMFQAMMAGAEMTVRIAEALGKLHSVPTAIPRELIDTIIAGARATLRDRTPGVQDGTKDPRWAEVQAGAEAALRLQEMLPLA